MKKQTSAAFAKLWRIAMAVHDPSRAALKYTYQVDVSNRPTLVRYRNILDGLRVTVIAEEFIDYREESLDEIYREYLAPGTVDVLVCHNYDGLRLDLVEGVRLVIFVNSSMKVVPPLPASVEMIILSRCNSLVRVIELPGRLHSLMIHCGVDANSAIDIEMPATLRSLSVANCQRIYLRGSMPPKLKKLYLLEIVHSEASEALPTSFRSIRYLIDSPADRYDYVNDLELSCGPLLKIFEVVGRPFHLSGMPVASLEEYQRACLIQRQKKSARSY